jgi:hypothetical protein
MKAGGEKETGAGSRASRRVCDDEEPTFDDDGDEEGPQGEQEEESAPAAVLMSPAGATSPRKRTSLAATSATLRPSPKKSKPSPPDSAPPPAATSGKGEQGTFPSPADTNSTSCGGNQELCDGPLIATEIHEAAHILCPIGAEIPEGFALDLFARLSDEKHLDLPFIKRYF